MEEAWYDKIEAYLGGSMSIEDIASFEAELKQNQLLQQEVELFDQLNHHIAGESKNEKILSAAYANDIRTFLRSEEARDIAEKLRKEEREYQITETPKSINYKMVAAIVGAIVILGTWILVAIHKDSPETLYEAYYSHEDLPSFVKRNDVEDKVYPIVDSFKREAYKEVLTAFETYKETTVVIDTTLYLYVGMSYLGMNENKNALASFDVMANSSLLDNSKGLWFKALAYLKMNDIENAKKTLQTILRNPSNFKFKQAAELLKLL